MRHNILLLEIFRKDLLWLNIKDVIDTSCQGTRCKESSSKDHRSSLDGGEKSNENGQEILQEILSNLYRVAEC